MNKKTVHTILLRQIYRVAQKGVHFSTHNIFGTILHKKVQLSGPPCTCIKVEEQSRFTSKTARQSPTLAYPAAPLATGVMKISSVDKTNRNWLPWQRLWRDQKTNF